MASKYTKSIVTAIMDKIWHDHNPSFKNKNLHLDPKWKQHLKEQTDIRIERYECGINEED